MRWKGYLSIVETLRAAVVSGEYPPGSLYPTERELCERFGASRPTVRKSLDVLVDEGWAYRMPNRGVLVGRGILPGSTRNVAIIHAGQPWFRPLFDLIHARFAERGWNAVDLGRSLQDPLEEALEYAQTQDMAGAVVWPYRGYVDDLRVERVAAQLPVVALDHPLGGADRVTFDHEAATELAVSALIEQGRRRIAVTGFLDVFPAMLERYRGFLAALFRAGLSPEPRNFLPVQLSGQRGADPLNLIRRLQDEDAPDGLLVFQESQLHAVRQWAEHAGRTLGHDLTLAATGGFPLSTPPPAGTVHVVYDNAALADQAFALLQDRIGHPSRMPRTVVVGHRLQSYEGATVPAGSSRASHSDSSERRS